MQSSGPVARLRSPRAAHRGARRHYAQKLFMKYPRTGRPNTRKSERAIVRYRFRAKFLALLPIASGTGLVLVFKDGDKALRRHK